MYILIVMNVPLEKRFADHVLNSIPNIFKLAEVLNFQLLIRMFGQLFIVT